MATAARTRGPKTRKAGAGTPTSTNFINSNNGSDNLIPMRAQLLVERFAMPIGVASLIANLAWGTAHG